MNRLLLITWCIKLSSENLLAPGVTTQFGSPTPELIDVGAINLKWPMVKTATVQSSTAKAEMPTTVKSQHDAYKNEYSYTISEVYDSKTEKNDLSPTVPDTQLVYHSFSNPLFRSNSLNIEPHGDIHKVSGPFQSSWIVSPSYRSIEKRKIPTLSSIFKRGNGKAFDFPDASTSPNDFHFNITLNNNTLDLMKSNSSFLTGTPLFNKLETFDDIAANIIVTTTTEQPVSQKVIYGYNFKEVTSNGKTHGSVQVFDNNGLKENVEYNEHGVMVMKPSNITTPTKNNTATVHTSKTQTPPAVNIPPSTVPPPKVDNQTKVQKPIESTTYIPEPPRHIIIENVQQPLMQEFSNDQPVLSDYATPEYILFDFLGQLQSLPAYMPNENDFDRNDRYTTFDEFVNENTFIYSGN